MLDKPSEFAERAVHEWTGQVFQDAPRARCSSGQYRLMIRTERTKARERKKYDAIESRAYTDEEIAEIDAQYAGEGPRGAEPRWWEDVARGRRARPDGQGAAARSPT